MIYKNPEFNKKKLPICEICGVGFQRVLQHVVQRHGMTSTEYKALHGYNPKKGIQSKQLRTRMRQNALKNYDTVIMKNLIIGGRNTRFKDGNTATDKELVSRLAKARMDAYWAEKRGTKLAQMATMTKILRLQTFN